MSESSAKIYAERLRRQHVRTTLINLSRTGELPALPQAASAALALARQPDADSEELCDLIATDVGLAARILRIANSAAYIRRAPARTIRDAVLALGMRKTCDVLVAACFRQVTATWPYCRLVMPCSCICRRATWPMNVIAPTSP